MLSNQASEIASHVKRCPLKVTQDSSPLRSLQHHIASHHVASRERASKRTWKPELLRHPEIAVARRRERRRRELSRRALTTTTSEHKLYSETRMVLPIPRGAFPSHSHSLTKRLTTIHHTPAPYSKHQTRCSARR